MSTERGAVVLVVVLLLPLLLFLLSLAVELSMYLRIHEELRRVLDDHGRSALRQGLSVSEVEASVRGTLQQYNAVLSSPDARNVNIDLEDGVVTIGATGAYHGFFSGALWGLISSKPPYLPVAVASRIRTMRTATLILFDRAVPQGRDLCTDADFERVKEFVGGVEVAYASRGSGSVAIGILPVGQEVGQILTASANETGVDECPLTNDLLLGSVAASHAATPDARTVAASVDTLVDEFFSSAGSPEVVSVLFVTRQESTPQESIELAAFSADRILRLMGLTARFAHIAIGTGATRARFSAEAPAYTRVPVASTQVLSADLIAALVAPDITSMVSR